MRVARFMALPYAPCPDQFFGPADGTPPGIEAEERRQGDAQKAFTPDAMHSWALTLRAHHCIHSAGLQLQGNTHIIAVWLSEFDPRQRVFPDNETARHGDIRERGAQVRL